MTEIKVIRDDKKATEIIKAIRCIDEGAEFAHVVRARWKRFDDYICATEFVCTNCRESFSTSELTDDEFVAMMRFCPNCGAKMDQEADENELC